MRVRVVILAISPFLIAGGLIIGCDAVGDSAGRVIVRMTDAPVENVTALDVTIESCEIIDSATGEHETMASTDAATVFNLLDFEGGATLDVCDQEVQLASFDQLRIVVGADASITIGDGEGAVQSDLHIASGSSSGLKLFLDAPVDLGDGATFTVLLDFVANESVHTTGPAEAPTGYVMTPVIRVVSAELNGQNLAVAEGPLVPVEGE